MVEETVSDQQFVETVAVYVGEVSLVPGALHLLRPDRFQTMVQHERWIAVAVLP